MDSKNDPVVSPERALETISGRVEGRALAGWWLLIAIGVAGFVLSVGDAPVRTWQIVWSNFLFWTAIAQAGVMFGAVLQAAKGHWGKGFRRLAEATAGFLPVSLVCFLLLWFGAGHIFPWLHRTDYHLNRSWLQPGHLFLRDGIALLFLYGLSFYFLRLSLRPDAQLIASRLSGWRQRLVAWLGRGWRGQEEETERSRHLLGRLSPALILLWAAIFSLMAIDIAMSLTPTFVSIVFGAYYFVGGWLCMLALVALMANRYNHRYGLEDVWGKWQFHDLGKLMFAFVIFWTYLWWSQFLVVWYGNLPRETIFFEQRYSNHLYTALYTAQMVLIFCLPFVLLLGRKPKMKPGWLAFVAILILAGFWLERYLLVVPATWHRDFLPMGWIEASVSVGFLGLFGLCYSLYVSIFPKLPIHETLVTGEARSGP